MSPIDNDYTPIEQARLQQHDVVGGTFWVGCGPEPGKWAGMQCVYASAEHFRLYVNRLLDAFGHLTYAELEQHVPKYVDKFFANQTVALKEDFEFRISDHVIRFPKGTRFVVLQDDPIAGKIYVASQIGELRLPRELLRVLRSVTV